MIDATVVDNPTRRKALWRVREDGAGLSSRLADPDDESIGDGYESWPGWEDAAVAPERLADYLDDFAELLDRHGLTGVMYGHFGAGCMHVRITFDLRSPRGSCGDGTLRQGRRTRGAPRRFAVRRAR